ncbi:unannotated protein [freshwater metagenome]|uniref:Unannotated protein n=1 Tax=freshwater metagenome TaxID=449393 RepID=A0A6J7EFK3_9ZZZZ
MRDVATDDGQGREDVHRGVGRGVAEVVRGGPDAGPAAVFFEGHHAGGQTTTTKEELARGNESLIDFESPVTLAHLLQPKKLLYVHSVAR